MTPQRLLIKTSKGVQSLLEGSIGLDDKHVRVLGLLDGTRQVASLAETTGYAEHDVQSILKKLTLIGYARALGVPSLGSAESPSSSFFGTETFGSVDLSESTSDLDIAALRSAAKAREHGISSPINLGSAEDAWQQTHELAQQLLGERLEREQASRLAAETALAQAQEREAQAKEREASLEKARQAAEEALSKSKEEARARAQAAAEADALRQQAYELEQARSRRLGVYRRRMRVGAVSALLVAGGLWGWRIANSVFVDAASCSRLLADWAQVDSSVASCKTSFFPSPRYEATGLGIGKIDAASIDGSLALLPLLVGRAEPTSLSIRGLRLDVNTIGALLRSPHKGRLGSVREVDIDGAKILMGNLVIDGLKGSATLDPQGQLNHLSLVDDERLARFSLANEKGAVKFSAQARFNDPASAPIPGSVDLSAYGTLDRDRLVVEDGSMGFKNGQAAFSGSLAWTANRWSGQGKVETHSIGLSDLAPWLFNGGSADLSGKFSFDGETPSLAAQDASLDVAGPGRSLSLRIDLPEMVGAPGSMGFSAFPQASIQMRLFQRSQTFTMPTLASGPFRANVEASLSANGKISGSATASMPDRGMSADMALSGTPQRIDLVQKNRSGKP